MCKSDALNVLLWAPAVICFCNCALMDIDHRFSMTSATVQQPYSLQKLTQTSFFLISSPDQLSYPFWNELTPGDSGVGYAPEADFSQRLQGGILLHFELGLIVVKPIAPTDSVQPTALTTDVIITCSVKSKIADEYQFEPRNFEIQTDDGVVTIHAKAESVDEAAMVINLALTVPDVRQIVYTMPSSV
jgi:hypothetical protein